MRELIHKIFLVILVGLLIMCGVATYKLNQSMNGLDIALDNLEQSITELELVMGIEDNGDGNE